MSRSGEQPGPPRGMIPVCGFQGGPVRAHACKTGRWKSFHLDPQAYVRIPYSSELKTEGGLEGLAVIKTLVVRRKGHRASF